MWEMQPFLINDSTIDWGLAKLSIDFKSKSGTKLGSYQFDLNSTTGFKMTTFLICNKPTHSTKAKAITKDSTILHYATGDKDWPDANPARKSTDFDNMSSVSTMTLRQSYPNNKVMLGDIALDTIAQDKIIVLLVRAQVFNMRMLSGYEIDSLYNMYTKGLNNTQKVMARHWKTLCGPSAVNYTPGQDGFNFMVSPLVLNGSMKDPLCKCDDDSGGSTSNISMIAIAVAILIVVVMTMSKK
jgi:hypothetical protein